MATGAIWRWLPSTAAWVAFNLNARISTGTGVCSPNRSASLVQQRPAQPYDQVERAVLDLIGAVDREVDLAVRGEGREMYPRGRGCGAIGGNADKT
jgi:hypothetical protein